MTIEIGQKIPEGIKLMEATAGGPRPVTTDEVFGGKKVVVFAVPGAFTPSCSASHLPGFIQHADAIKAKGVDTIACLSTNDAFVLQAWGTSQDAGDKVMMLSDGNGDFVKALDLTLDASGFGMGMRSTRFSMIVENGVVKSLNVESNPGEVAASSAEKVIEQL